jgi:hypothetical protein
MSLGVFAADPGIQEEHNSRGLKGAEERLRHKVQIDLETRCGPSVEYLDRGSSRAWNVEPGIPREAAHRMPNV